MIEYKKQQNIEHVLEKKGYVSCQQWPRARQKRMSFKELAADFIDFLARCEKNVIKYEFQAKYRRPLTSLPTKKSAWIFFSDQITYYINNIDFVKNITNWPMNISQKLSYIPFHDVSKKSKIF